MAVPAMPPMAVACMRAGLLRTDFRISAVCRCGSARVLPSSNEWVPERLWHGILVLSRCSFVQRATPSDTHGQQASCSKQHTKSPHPTDVTETQEGMQPTIQVSR